MNSSPKLKSGRKWPKSFPRVVADLNLDLPALLEASAGTGKTYAIEHLVLRLVAEKPDWNFESLLLLSFTEKTAGDLRKRVRERLKKESLNDSLWTSEERKRFFEAHLRCDEASIHTLHGFCHSVLRAHALENGTLFDSELAEENVLLESALEGLLRGPWAHDETRLRALLKALSELELPRDWQRHLVTVALSYQPGRGDVLEPSPSSSELSDSKKEFDEALEKLDGSFQELEGGGFDDHLQSFGDTKTGKDNLRRDIFVRLYNVRLSCSGMGSPEKTEAFLDFFLSLKGNLKAVQKGFSACVPVKAAKDARWLEFAESCENSLRAAKRWAEAKRQSSFGLVAEAIRDLRKRLAWEKKRHGTLSYNDMILRLVEAVRIRPGLVDQLRDRYRACIVDEFQDTDPLQWELLQRLCFGDPRIPGGSRGFEGKKKIPLFLVGDPKQAIYGFRGGDLPTYLGARALYHERALHGQAQGKGLKENYRSRPELVRALNAVFAEPDWFDLSSSLESSESWQLPEASNSIPFTPAILPEDKSSLTPGKARLIWRDFAAGETEKAQSKADVQKSVHAWIAGRIQDLVVKESFRFGDIAILTRTNTEAMAAERHLRRLGIPCRVRRKGGLFEGVQADQIRLLLGLLESAENPKTQAQILLLPFLRVEWPRGVPEECPASIRQWAALAEAGEWPQFFHAVLYESGYLYRLAAAAQTGGGSEVQTLRALARVLTEEGVRKGHSLRGLMQRFDELRGGEGEDSGETADETADGSVTLMTLHMSKGLEFSVVFLASLSDGRKPAFYTLRGEKGFRHVLDKKNEEALQEYQRQSLDEDKRLFYVGLTRAMDFLYLPLLPEKSSRTGFGPLGGFAAKALRHAGEQHPDLFNADADPLPSLSSSHYAPSLKQTAVIGMKTGTKKGMKSEAPAFPEKDPWEEAGAFFQDRRRRLSSYSQLLKHEIATVLEEDGRRLDREEGEAESSGPDISEAAQAVSGADLPGGKNTGNALHELLETLDFSAVGHAPDIEAWLKDSKLLENTKRILRGHGVSEEHAPVALRVAWNTLHMPLPDPAGGEAFQLASVLDRRHEMEFLFPFAGLSTGRLPEKTESRSGYLWGFMDLIFRHGGRYYVLDWKSNLLENYGASEIEAHMRKSHYDLQYQLYAVALDKWLTARLPGYDAEKEFGGVFYLYLRGASPRGFSGFAHRPSTQELRKDYPGRLRTALGLKFEPQEART